jgi:hypothetical protein
MTHLNVMDTLLGTGLLAFAGGYFTRIKGVLRRKAGKTKQCCDRHRDEEKQN